MKSKTPPMGWNSWNTFGNDISDQLIRQTADVIVDSGLKDLGYEYVVIDDCWSKRQRDAEGYLVPDHEKFPNGMKAVGDYVHGKGLKFGMYSCGGTMTCAGYPGSFEHEFTDAKTFAGWGVDYLKYDYCYHPSSVPGPLMYRRMTAALKNCGRDIFFAACNWGAEKSELWMPECGADSFRSTGDIQDNWQSIKGIEKYQITENSRFCGRPGCFNDMDMLVVGMKNIGNVALGGCSNEEYKTHFALWCMHSSPLIIGCDVRNMDEETKKILANRELIAIDQDAEARPPFLAMDPDAVDRQMIYVKILSDGSYAICFANYSDAPMSMTLLFWELGLPDTCGYGLKFRDLWEHEDIGVFHRDFTSKDIPAHGTHVYRAEVVKLA